MNRTQPPYASMAGCRQLSVLAVVLTLTVASAGCGAKIAPETSGSSRPVTIRNCGERTTYPRPPQRAIAYDMSGTEKMFALGLADRMRGIVMPTTANPAVRRSPYLEDYRSVDVLSTDVLSREVAVDAKSDWVLAGWDSGFGVDRGITPELLADVGIKSYQYTESCFNYGTNPVEVPPLRALYVDLRQIGSIFHVEDRADRLVADLKARAAELRRQRPQSNRARVFVYDSGTDQPFTSGNQAAPHAIVSLAGGRNILDGLHRRWTTVGWEPVVAARPEVIAVVNYGDQPVQDKIDFLKSFPPLASTPAVRNRNFHVLDYGEAVSGPRNIDAAEDLAAYLRSIGH